MLCGARRCPRAMIIHTGWRVSAPRRVPPCMRCACRHPGRLRLSSLSMLLSASPFPKATARFFLLTVSLAAVVAMAGKTELPHRDRALKGRQERMVVAGKNQNNAATSGTRYVTRRSLVHDVITLSSRLFLNRVDVATLLPWSFTDFLLSLSFPFAHLATWFCCGFIFFICCTVILRRHDTGDQGRF